MEALKSGERHAVHPARRGHGARHARRFRLSRARHRAQEEPGQCAGEDPGRFLACRRWPISSSATRSPTASASSSAREALARAERLRAGASSSSCSPSPRRFPPSSRAASPSARASVRSSRRRRCWSASSIRSSKASPGTSASACRSWLKAHVRRGVPRLRRLGRRARDGRLDRRCRPCCCSARGAGAIARTARSSAHPPSSIPFLALGAWILCVGWFGFNVMSAQTLDKISGLVAINSLMAMVGGTLAALAGRAQRPGLRPQRPAGGPGGGLRRLGRHASDRRAGRPARSPARSSSACSR